MIKCDVCGDINRNGVSLPAGWKNDNMEEICQKCAAELERELVPVKQSLQSLLNQNVQATLARMQARPAMSSPISVPTFNPDPGCGADECVPQCCSCEGGDADASGQ